MAKSDKGYPKIIKIRKKIDAKSAKRFESILKDEWLAGKVVGIVETEDFGAGVLVQGGNGFYIYYYDDKIGVVVTGLNKEEVENRLVMGRWGSRTSARKQQASRDNGRRGGRPKTDTKTEN